MNKEQVVDLLNKIENDDINDIKAKVGDLLKSDIMNHINKKRGVTEPAEEAPDAGDE
jgi:hypothetical protein